ncbi:hypothetical protein [Corynebacterium sphenisci]|uniref:hypothetical protein n=1 Tax=Corynebacterium sphenisci TaxID=191493 RepID=UPI0026DEABED|nr:hypothetical protein [Corynebacterium sphenisci]MDO5730495.1 hypothetical protein [Corynebacterium sphenisci]
MTPAWTRAAAAALAAGLLAPAGCAGGDAAAPLPAGAPDCSRVYREFTGVDLDRLQLTVPFEPDEPGYVTGGEGSGRWVRCRIGGPGAVQRQEVLSLASAEADPEVARDIAAAPLGEPDLPGWTGRWRLDGDVDALRPVNQGEPSWRAARCTGAGCLVVVSYDPAGPDQARRAALPLVRALDGALFGEGS